jgi:hypothetical protein
LRTSPETVSVSATVSFADADPLSPERVSGDDGGDDV